jgi:hypothetical protein
MVETLELSVIGRASMWKRRMAVDGARVWTAWLHHPAYGTLGVYVPDHEAPLGAALPDRSFIEVRGYLHPLRVSAREDDPRSEADVSLAPLLIQAVSISRCDRATFPPPLPLQQARVRGGRWIEVGSLACTTDYPTLVCLVRGAQTCGAVAHWNRPYGVLMTLGTRRYLRYMLIQVDGREAA